MKQKSLAALLLAVALFAILSVTNSLAQNCAKTSVGFLPLNDLGTGMYKGYQGGLYPNGLNTRPSTHNAAGLTLASQIQPLDTLGKGEPKNGKIVLLTIGMSNTSNESSAFLPMADTFKLKNPNVVLVNGAQGGQTAQIIMNPTANFWTVILQRLRQQRVHENQVQAIWFKEANASPTDSAFPNYANTLRTQFKTIMTIMKNKYPNLKLCYLSNRIYGGYASSNLNPEPYAYHSAWSVKWVIEDQVKGDTSLTYTGANAKSPWLAWGPNLWADGLTPRSDGLVWKCPDDFTSDGTHPSQTGSIKVARLLLDFFSHDETTASWFNRSTSTGIKEETPTASAFVLQQNFPNPFSSSTTIEVRFENDDLRITRNADSQLKSRITNLKSQITLRVFDLLGREVLDLTEQARTNSTIVVRASELPAPGMYFYRLSEGHQTQVRRMVVVH